MNKLWFILCLCVGGCMQIQSQTVSVKTNLLYDATTTPNLGVEVAFNKHLSLNLSGNYNPWTFSDNKSIKHWMAEPEFRYWIHERFNGHYLGAHVQYWNYDFAGVKLPFGMEKEYAYQGTAYGGGISYGYQLYLSPHWNVEFTAGVGYLEFEYDKLYFPETDNQAGKYRNQYWGLTKVGVSIVYIIK